MLVSPRTLLSRTHYRNGKMRISRHMRQRGVYYSFANAIPNYFTSNPYASLSKSLSGKTAHKRLLDWLGSI
jgi:hypothetical protein